MGVSGWPDFSRNWNPHPSRRSRGTKYSLPSVLYKGAGAIDGPPPPLPLQQVAGEGGRGGWVVKKKSSRACEPSERDPVIILSWAHLNITVHEAENGDGRHVGRHIAAGRSAEQGQGSEALGPDEGQAGKLDRQPGKLCFFKYI